MYNNDRYARERARKGGVELQELMRKKAFISDMDGVIYHGNLLLPGVREFVNWLEANGKEYIFLTNSSARSPKELKQQLRRLGLEAWAGETVEALSGGMQRRVAIARALLAEFDILVLDEPFRGLDEATKQEVIAMVLEEAAGRTILVATHDIKEVQWMGGKVLNLDEWR